jgi:hypothetical protein
MGRPSLSAPTGISPGTLRGSRTPSRWAAAGTARLRPTRFIVACAVAALAACEGQPPSPVLAGAEPQRAYSDRRQRLILRGDGFLPSYRIDPAAGRREAHASGFGGWVGDARSGQGARLTDFGWRAPTLLSATLEPGLPAGAHDVVVIDPRGARAVLPGGFVALGPDQSPPALAIERPAEDAPVAPGLTIEARLVARDGPGRLLQVRWEARGRGAVVAGGECPVDADPALVTCDFSLQVPPSFAEGELLELHAVAVDEAPAANTSEVRRTLRLRARPRAVAVTPGLGGAAGGTDVVVRGAGFLPGSRVLFGGLPLSPDGGLVVDEHMITGRAPPHPPGKVAVTVQTPLGDATGPDLFEYRAPPRVLSIVPATSPPEGGVVLQVRGEDFTPDTSVYLGRALAEAVPLRAPVRLGAQEIRGLAPPGAGKATVWVLDPQLGFTALRDGFAWGAPADAGPPRGTP